MRQTFVVLFCCLLFASQARAQNTVLERSTQIIKDLTERLKTMQDENTSLQKRSEALANQLLELKGQPIGELAPTQTFSASSRKRDLGYDFSINFEKSAQPQPYSTSLSNDLDAALSSVEERLRALREGLNRPMRRTLE